MIFKSPEAVIRNAIISDASVTQYVGHRVYADLATAQIDLPFIIYRRSDISREQTLGVPMGVPRVSVEIGIFAETRLESRKIADAVRSTLDGYGGSFENTTVRQTSLESESDEIAALDGSEVANAYSVTQTYDIWWQET
jgi:ethanolamine utilization protein EutP (predicted NTPase)